MTAYALTTILFLAGSAVAVGAGVKEALVTRDWRDVQYASALILITLILVALLQE